jgi:hypothetical protein
MDFEIALAAGVVRIVGVALDPSMASSVRGVTSACGICANPSKRYSGEPSGFWAATINRSSGRTT